MCPQQQGGSASWSCHPGWSCSGESLSQPSLPLECLGGGSEHVGDESLLPRAPGELVGVFAPRAKTQIAQLS